MSLDRFRAHCNWEMSDQPLRNGVSMSNRGTPSIDRIWFMDYARYWLVLIVLLFHSVVSQIGIRGKGFIFDPRPLGIADILWFVGYTFQMPLLFFISGFVVIPSLQPKGFWRFARVKIYRLIVPGFIVLLLLNPVRRYIVHYSTSFTLGVPQMSFFEYWPVFFRNANWFQIGSPGTFEFELMHLWYVTLLFAFVIVTALAVGVIRLFSASTTAVTDVPASRRSVAAALILTSVIAWAATLIWMCWVRSLTWIMLASFLLIDLCSLGIHASYFCLGIVAYKRQWFSRPGILGPTWIWIVPTILLTYGAGVLFYRSIGNPELLDNYSYMAGFWALRTLACLGWFGLLFSVWSSYCNRRSKLQDHFASLSYRVYLMHMVIVTLVQVLILRLPGLNPWVVLLGTAFLSLTLTYLLALALTKPAKIYAKWTRVGGSSGNRLPYS
jgi:glucans biosynthesis protein C